MRRIGLTITAALTFAMLPACQAGEEGEDAVAEGREGEGDEGGAEEDD